MSFKLDKLSTTLSLADHPVTLVTHGLNTDLTMDEIKKKLQDALDQGQKFVLPPGTTLEATLAEIATWIKSFDKDLELPPDLLKLAGKKEPDEVVTIYELSVNLSTKVPAFSIGMRIGFSQDFYNAVFDAGIPEELRNWFEPNSMGISMSYAKGKAQDQAK